MKSMTGYGKTQDNTSAGVVSVEMISVNHRNLDLRLRIPDAFRFVEIDIRNLIKAKLRRGHVEVAVRVEPDPESASGNIAINLPAALAYHREAAKFYHAVGNAKEAPVPSWIFGMKDVWNTPDPADSHTIKEALLFLSERALTALIATRASEGATLEAFFEQKTRGLLPIVEGITGLKDEIPAQARAALEARIRDLGADSTVSPDRLAQEITLLVQRADITEEVSRLGAHIKNFLEKIHQPDIGGKELDFILQEMNRETNTMGSKSASYQLSALMIQLKETISQLREQVQNVE